MDQPLISVIVPVYNVELYLDRCVKSILSQTYHNLEIILVDDGSTDRSGAMCDEYAAEDSRIRVIHKENGGLSDARNAALDAMTGEYVTCVDGDDLLSSVCIENLFCALAESKSDIACCQFLYFFDNDKLPTFERLNQSELLSLDRESYFRKMLYQDGAEVSACAKLYKSVFFADVRFPKGKLYEDVATTYLLIEQAERIACIPNQDYLYYQRAGSIIRGSFNKRKMDIITHMTQLKKFIEKNYPSLENAMNCRYFSAVCNVLFLIEGKEYENERLFLWNEAKKYRKCVLLDKEGRKKARVAAGLSFMGYGVLKWVYSLGKR